jgi:putative transcriptional regulator
MRNRLRELRQERDWTQKDLAKALGVSRQTIIAIERGKYAPSLPLAFRISRVLDHPLDTIFFAEDDL